MPLKDLYAGVFPLSCAMGQGYRSLSLISAGRGETLGDFANTWDWKGGSFSAVLKDRLGGRVPSRFVVRVRSSPRNGFA